MPMNNDSAHSRPGYVRLHETGELQERIDDALRALRQCTLCPRECGVDRTQGETGFCGVGRRAHVASFGPHFGEEDILVGSGGSGAIFFSGCNLGCVFCQNEDISRVPDAGPEADPDGLAGAMLDLQRCGCANINLVTPSHVVPHILEALPVAVEHGLYLPIVYNCGGYDSVDTLAMLEGVVDIYMPDAKVWDSYIAAELLRASDYPERARAAIREMYRQTGDLVIEQGLAAKGLLVRHLVLPEGRAGSEHWGKWLFELSPDTWVNVMGQYHPCAQAMLFDGMDRLLTRKELCEAFTAMQRSGLRRFDGENRLFRLCSVPY